MLFVADISTGHAQSTCDRLKNTVTRVATTKFMTTIYTPQGFKSIKNL
jgi:hypothetical protein